MKDGQTDYSHLSDAELKFALVDADPMLNPLDWQNVRTEVQRRRDHRRFRMLPIMRRVVGWYLVPLLLWAAAGICLLRKVRAGLTLGMVALAFQLLSFAFGKVDYHFSPIYSLYIGWMDSDIGFRFDFGAVERLRIGKAVPLRFAVDLVAAYGMIILWRSLRIRARQTAADEAQPAS